VIAITDFWRPAVPWFCTGRILDGCSVIARRSPVSQTGIAWIALWAAPALHVTDEAVSGFLYVYNPTAIELRERLGFWLLPTFSFRERLTGKRILRTTGPGENMRPQQAEDRKPRCF
jgi:hypothetical protein